MSELSESNGAQPKGRNTEKIVKFFQIFSNVSTQNLNIFEYFRTFSNVFARIFLAYFTQTLQTNLPNPIFTPKTNIPTKKNSKNPNFS